MMTVTLLLVLLTPLLVLLTPAFSGILACATQSSTRTLMCNTSLHYRIPTPSTKAAVPAAVPSLPIATASSVKEPVQAYCTPNHDHKMCAMGIGVKNPTQVWNQISKNTTLDISLWNSECQSLCDPATNFTLSRTEPNINIFLPDGGKVSISAQIPLAAYEHCHDESSLSMGSYRTCASLGFSEIPCGCTPPEKQTDCFPVCAETLYDKCVLFPGFIEFNATSWKGEVSSHNSSLSVTTRAGSTDACNCDKKWMNDCPAEYVFCCGCEFRCKE